MQTTGTNFSVRQKKRRKGKRSIFHYEDSCPLFPYLKEIAAFFHLRLQVKRTLVHSFEDEVFIFFRWHHPMFFSGILIANPLAFLPVCFVGMYDALC